MIVLALVFIAADEGLRLRRWAWDFCAPLHFRSDITRGYGWGVMASGTEGFLNPYEKMARQGNDWSLWLDYAPLRLAVMTRWAAHNRAAQPNPTYWRPDYDFNRPVLYFNAAMEGVGVVAAFFLVRKVVRDSGRGPPRRSWPGEWADRLRGRTPPPLPLTPSAPFHGWAHGLAAALLLWFNPAMILSAHGWPTWDIWIVPMFLLALLAAVHGRWTCAGLAIGVGVMFKGQQFVGLPVFLAWTLLNGDWRGAMRFAAGVGIAIAAVASPWLVTAIDPAQLAEFYANQKPPTGSLPQQYAPLVAARHWNRPAIGWTLGVAVVAVALPVLRQTASRRGRYGTLAATILLLLWPAAMLRGTDWLNDLGLLAAVGGGTALAAVYVRSRVGRVRLVVAATAAALLAGLRLFGASSAWWDCGIAYGTDHFRHMVMGLTDNLPGLLQQRFGWQSIDEVVFTAEWPARLRLAAGPVDVTIRQFTRGLMVLATLPCLWAVARHARRRDRRLLVAVTAPWMVFFCLPTQIHERYLIYAAAIGSIWVAQSVGMALLAALLTLATLAMQLHVMLVASGRPRGFGEALHAWRPEWFDATAGDTLLRNLAATFPDLAYANLTAMLVVIYVAVCRTPQPWSAGRSAPDQARSHDDAAAGDDQNASDGASPSGRNAAEQR